MKIMNLRWPIHACLFFASLAPAFPQSKAVFIICDGIPADVVERVSTPTLDSIATLGGYTRAYVGGQAGGYSESPTISAVGYNDLLTGTWANKHNVWGNNITAPNYHYWNLFRIIAQDSSRTTAVFSTWLDNRTKLVGDRLPQAGNIKVDYYLDGLENDTVHYPHDDRSYYIHEIDETVSKNAAQTIASKGPDLSWVYLEYTDDMGHRYGDSPELDSAVAMADQQVGRVWRAIRERERKLGERWLIVITTDHGRSAADGRDHGGQSTRERTTWIVTNVKGNDHFNEQPGITDIMPSILNFMNVPVPSEVRDEIDGVPFIGPVAASKLHAIGRGDTIDLTWNALEQKGVATIYVATTNHFAEGGVDHYKKVATVPLISGHYTIDVHDRRSAFYKILLKTAINDLNTWIKE
jgi:Type I phosphodiesterase / nucleotide pyrophosphatase